MNKPFSIYDYDEFDYLGKGKGAFFAEMAGTEAIIPDEQKDHFDVVMRIAGWDEPLTIGDRQIPFHDADHTLEMEVRDNHYDRLYNGAFSDVRVPHRKLAREVPDLLGVVSAEPLDTRVILVLRDHLEGSIPNKYWTKTVSCPDGEWMVPFDKNCCHRFQVIDGRLEYQGTVP